VREAIACCASRGEQPREQRKRGVAAADQPPRFYFDEGSSRFSTVYLDPAPKDVEGRVKIKF
jgi:hypothetical protein